MSITMSITVLIIATVTLAVDVKAGQTELLQFCSTLNQSTLDANHCYDKPKTYSIGNDSDNFILAYLCCVDYFTDVTYDYMPFMSTSFVLHISTLKNENVLLDIGRFLQMCNRVLRGNAPYTEQDYAFWSKNGKTSSKCKSSKG